MGTTGIYKLTNMCNNKVYIGQAWDIEKRWANHRTYSHKKETHLYSAIRKYGIENFLFEILESFPKSVSQIDLDEKEERYILLFESLNPLKGYNKRHGGSSGLLLKEHKDKIKKAATGRVFPEDVKLKMAEKKTGINSPIAKKVRCIETGVEYISKREAGKAVSPDNFKSAETAIAYCCYGQRNTAKGYHWEYVN